MCESLPSMCLTCLWSIDIVPPMARTVHVAVPRERSSRETFVGMCNSAIRFSLSSRMLLLLGIAFVLAACDRYRAHPLQARYAREFKAKAILWALSPQDVKYYKALSPTNAATTYTLALARYRAESSHFSSETLALVGEAARARFCTVPDLKLSGFLFFAAGMLSREVLSGLSADETIAKLRVLMVLALHLNEINERGAANVGIGLELRIWNWYFSGLLSKVPHEDLRKIGYDRARLETLKRICRLRSYETDFPGSDEWESRFRPVLK